MTIFLYLISALFILLAIRYFRKQHEKKYDKNVEVNEQNISKKSYTRTLNVRGTEEDNTKYKPIDSINNTLTIESDKNNTKLVKSEKKPLVLCNNILSDLNE